MMRDSSVRFRWWRGFLCSALLASLPGLAMGGLSGDTPLGSAPAQNQGKIMQFESGGHILGFDSDKV